MALQLIGSAIDPVTANWGTSSKSSTTGSASSNTTAGGAGAGSALGSALYNTASASGGSSGVVGNISNAVSAASAANRIGTATGLICSNPQLSAGIGAAGDVLGIYSGLERQGGLGYAGAAVSAAGLANNGATLLTGTPLLCGTGASLLGGAGDVLGILNGIKSGTPAGYATAGIDTLQLANTADSLLSSGGAAAGGSAAAGGAGSAAATAGSAIGGAAGLGIVGALAAYALSTAPTTYGTKYWNGLLTCLTSNTPTGANVNSQAPTSAVVQSQQFGAVQEVAEADSAGVPIPGNVLQAFQSITGMTPAEYNQQMSNMYMSGPKAGQIVPGGSSGVGVKPD